MGVPTSEVGYTWATTGRGDHEVLALFFLELETFQTKFVEKIKTHILCSLAFFPENCALYVTMWKNTVERDRSQMALHDG
jgi:hypothetical protein